MSDSQGGLHIVSTVVNKSTKGTSYVVHWAPLLSALSIHFHFSVPERFRKTVLVSCPGRCRGVKRGISNEAFKKNKIKSYGISSIFRKSSQVLFNQPSVYNVWLSGEPRVTDYCSGGSSRPAGLMTAVGCTCRHENSSDHDNCATRISASHQHADPIGPIHSWSAQNLYQYHSRSYNTPLTCTAGEVLAHSAETRIHIQTNSAMCKRGPRNNIRGRKYLPPVGISCQERLQSTILPETIVKYCVLGTDSTS